MQRLNLPNTAVTVYSYDGLQRLTSVDNLRGDNSLISRYAYGYNTRDVRTYVDEQVGTSPVRRTSYAHDEVDQLTGEVSNVVPTLPYINNSYAYDAMGNRTAKQSTAVDGGVAQASYTPNKLNQLTSYSTTSGGTTSNASLSYDAGGNLVSARQQGGQGGTTYTYDDADRLTSIVQKDEATGANLRKSEFIYDGADRKVISREFIWSSGAWQQQSEIRRLYDGMDVVQERDGTNSVTVNYTRDGNIGGLLARSTAGGHFFHHYDGSGNVVQLTDAAQASAAEYSYDAYGNLLTMSGPQSNQPYRYSTKEFHAPSGLYDYGYRFYSPAFGRWTSRDPIEEEGGIHLYAFVENDPINKVDEYGLQVAIPAPIPLPPPVAVGVVVVGGCVIVGKAIYDYYTRPENEKEHTKRRGSKKKTNDKHTKPRPGRPNERKKMKPDWKPANPNRK